MKQKLPFLLATVLLASPCVAPKAEAAFGAISVSFDKTGPLAINETVLVSLNLSGYTESTEMDGWSFRVLYDMSLFDFVGSTFSYDPTQQWLAKSNQEGGSYTPSSFDDGSVDGVVAVSLADTGFTAVEQGSNSASGFLVSFQLKAQAPGLASVTPAGPAGGTLFTDKDLNSVAGSPTFVGASITIIPEPSATALALAGLMAFIGKRRR